MYDGLFANRILTRDLIEERIELLKEIMLHKEKDVSKAPKGLLHIANRGKYTSYYQRIDPKDPTGLYIRKKDISLAFDLAQREYDEMILKLIKTELWELESIRNYFDNDIFIDYLDSMPEKKQNLLTPLYKREEEYLKQWEEETYVGKSFSDNETEYFTDKGERVRSKSEVLIANLLYRYGIPYKYEYPLYINGIGYVYPDFSCLNVRERRKVILEHFGKMDDPSYVNRSVLPKLRAYENMGLILGKDYIFTMESSEKVLSSKYLEKIVEKYLL